MEPVGTLDNKAYKKQNNYKIQRFSSSWRLQPVLKMMSVGATHRAYLKPPRSSRKKQKLQYVTGRPTKQETQTSAQTKKALNPPRRHDTSRCRCLGIIRAAPITSSSPPPWKLRPKLASTATPKLLVFFNKLSLRTTTNTGCWRNPPAVS